MRRLGIWAIIGWLSITLPLPLLRWWPGPYWVLWPLLNIYQGWVQLHKITSITITITLKYQPQLQLHHHDVILNYKNYNYTMFISITITAPFLHKLHFYLWNCGLIGFSCFPCLACCLVPTQPRNALRLHNIATSDTTGSDSISCVGELN